jgi:hypothetical protein
MNASVVFRGLPFQNIRMLGTFQSGRTGQFGLQTHSNKVTTSLMLVVCVGLVLASFLQAQEAHKIIKFNVPGAGTGESQGTYVAGIVLDGSIMGLYIDSSGRFHGFLRSPTGKFTKFDCASRKPRSV